MSKCRSTMCWSRTGTLVTPNSRDKTYFWLRRTNQSAKSFHFCGIFQPPAEHLLSLTFSLMLDCGQDDACVPSGALGVDSGVPSRHSTVQCRSQGEDTQLVAWSRLSGMGWSELSTRLQQEVGKRLDLAAYWTGLHRGGLVTSKWNAAPTNFFFAQSDLPRIVELLRERFPSDMENTMRNADEICLHRFSLLGYTELDHGRTIDWHLDAVSGKRAPLKPWFKIHYLDFNEVGDHKVIWELNRHQHLVTLAQAWLFTGNKAYVDEVIAELNSWWRANPYPIGVNWASTLEVAFRSLSWLWLTELLAGCELLPSSFSSQLLSGLAMNGRYIERYLSTYFSPNTHLLGEAVALFFIGTLCPQLPAAARWQRKGWQILTQEIQRQVRPDGVYFEQALYYHVYALDFFLHARILAARNGVEIPQEFDASLERMLQVLRSLAQAGPPEAFGDDDGGRVFNPRRNRTEHLSDPLALGAILYGQKDSAVLTEESIWLFGEAAVNGLARSGEQAEQGDQIEREQQLASAAFPDGGLYVMADAASHAQIVIDAGPQGTGRCGHGHADALAILLSSKGRRWLVDSGTYRYISGSNSDDRNIFRGTAAHNTLRVDRMDQAVPDGPFAWSSIPQVSVDRWVQGESFDFLVGHHDGYTRLPQPVTHRRYVFRLAGGLWMVRDVAEGAGTHELEIFWHFAFDLDLSERTATAITAMPRRVTSETSQLAILGCANETAWNLRMGVSEISPAYGLKSAAPRASFVASSRLPVDCAVLLVPGIADAPVGELISQPGSAADGLRAYRYLSGNMAHHFLFSQGDPWKSGSWASDARFMYYGLEDGQLAHLIMVDGSFASWQEMPVVKLRHKVDRFERIQREGTLKTFCSESGALDHNFEGRLSCFDTVVRT